VSENSRKELSKKVWMEAPDELKSKVKVGGSREELGKKVWVRHPENLRKKAWV
jgi:hypothetical protein